MNTFNDNDLIIKIKTLVHKERELTSEILHYFREVERRRLYAKRGYSSLFDFATKELKYSESQAQRRISAMRLLKELPVIEEKIKSGELSLTVISQAQSFFRQEAKSKRPYKEQEKVELLRTLENTSKREAEKKLLKISPQSLPKEKVRAITEMHTEIKLVLDENLKAKLDQLRNLLSHKNQNMSYKELIEEMAELSLNKLDPRRKKVRTPIKTTPALKQNSDHDEMKPESQIRQRSVSIPGKVTMKTSHIQKEQHIFFTPREKVNRQIKQTSPQRINRYIPAVLLRQKVWMRDKGCCAFKDLLTGRTCTSNHRLQLDHIVPISFGGNSQPENLRLLCATHNQLVAIEKLGAQKMESYVPSLKT